MTAIRHHPQVNPEHRVQPAPGTILMWPAFLHHLVHSNLSQTARISISFNIVLKQSSAHLPASNPLYQGTSTKSVWRFVERLDLVIDRC